MDVRVTSRDVGIFTITYPLVTSSNFYPRNKKKSFAFLERRSDFAAGGTTKMGQIRRGECRRNLCSLENQTKSTELNSLEHRSSHPQTRCSRRETSLAFSTSPLHSIPPSPSLSLSYKTRHPMFPPESKPNQSCCCPVSCPTTTAAASLQSNQFSAATSNVCTGGGRRVHGRDREGAAGPARPHLQQELRAHHAPPRVRPPRNFGKMCGVA